MKKIFIMLLMLITTINFSSCGNDKPAQNDKIKVVATIFPIYDWTREIIDDNQNFELTLLMNNGIDLHSFQPSAQDMMKISDCDVFIYVGGESDDWIADALKNSKNNNMIIVNLMDALGDKVKSEEHVEGMEYEHEHEEESENDEHIWLSLKNAQILCDSIESALEKASHDDNSDLKKNLDAYKSEIATLDKKYQDIIANSQGKILLFGDRFPFRYLVDDYGLKYFAVFTGCSAETEANFQTIKFLAEKVDELNLPCVMTIDGTNHKIAETIIVNTTQKNQKILVVNSMQSKIDGENYLSIMEKNLSVLKEALE